MAAPPKERTTDSGIPVAPYFDAPEMPVPVPPPGTYPYTRGIYPEMYRARRWTMRQYAGFASAEATNERFKALLAKGQTGLSVAFDLPTQLGYDADDPMAAGEVGKVGVSISRLDDMRMLFDGIPLGEVTTSMTINAPAAILLLMYQIVGEEQGADARKLGGTIQNDPLKEYQARGTYIYPPRPSMRLVTDTFAYCAKHLPQWNPISISGYHMREAGCSAAQEIAFTLAERDRLCRGGARGGPGGGRLRAAPLLLLRRAQRPLRGSGEVPRRPPPLGDDDARAVRRAGQAVAAPPLPHPDVRLHAHRAAAVQQTQLNQ